MSATKNPPGGASAAGADDEEDDYMTMTFGDDGGSAKKPETSLQRRQRERREAEARSRPKSKAELAADEAARRESALSRSLLSAPQATKSKGLAMMARMGFAPGSALGAPGNADARAEPLRLAVKEDRGGVGAEEERRRKFREEVGEEALEEAERRKKKMRIEDLDPAEFRDRVARERDAARKERQVHAAQKVAEGMAEQKERGEDGRETERSDDEVSGDEAQDRRKRQKKTKGGMSSRPLKSINVLWRGLVRAREEAERDRRMRYDLEQSLSRLPTYEDDLDDEDDKVAMGTSKTVVYATAEDLDEEDPELDEFNTLEPDEKLQRLVEFMRKEFHYCFWCKFTYPDETMEGCPGLTEDDHD
ncbi:uncharacterized protein E0L32_000628 [Thyridium curvatum]|uniref:G-patch domain-containing protein n=1 Tax=Thyridium curvatum TaxID=1093900 RepID=A0A507B687_9PEZI|nr:uncharacterized protein E0L32_000628 [Thyridium curvatum]TPX14234.1 hypothetical protein E0L32_000628 [Thyridium curvatum]